MFKTMGKRLEYARIMKNMKIVDVGSALGISPSIIEEFEMDKENPSVEHLRKLSDLYDVTLDWLIAGKGASENILRMKSYVDNRIFDEEKLNGIIIENAKKHHYVETEKALSFAWKQHDGQYRKSSTFSKQIPYINHPLTMAVHAIHLKLMDDQILAACILHDVCEDCGVTPENLPVDIEIQEAVRLLTKPKSYDKSDEAEKRYYSAILGNKVACIVKILDRCNNLSTMGCFTDDHMARYIIETKRWICTLLEEAYLKYPEYSDALFNLQYQMRAIISIVGHTV